MESFSLRILLLIAGLLPLLLGTYQALHTSDDPYRCRAVLNHGQWDDPPDEKGNRAPFTKWRTDGCLFHTYNNPEIRQCFQGRHAVFVGDSTTRQVALGLGRLLNKKETTWQRWHMNINRSFNLTLHGIEIQIHWKPFLRLSHEDHFTKQLDLLREERDDPPPVNDQKAAALTMVGVGAWHSTPRNGYPDPVGAIAEIMTNISTRLDGHRDFVTGPMDPVDGIGSPVFWAPTAGPYYINVSDTFEFGEKTQAAYSVLEMQEYVRERNEDFNFDVTWAIPETIHNQNKTIRDPYWNGFHVIETVADVKANILLNLRCNAKLDRIKGFPYNRTCCTDYGSLSFVQLGVLTFSMVYLIACIAGEAIDMVCRRSSPGWRWLNMRVGAFPLAVLLCYYADRTQLFAKGEKSWSHQDFLVFCAPFFILALISIRKSAIPASSNSSPSAIQEQEPALSRDQTYEWKGWMQVVILIYHWTSGDESPGMSNFARVLIAAYFFLTGYGHTTYFLTEKDFSFKRVASVLLRLNLLPCVLAYAMNTEYMMYYFAPLCSFWFLVIYITMGAGHSRFNGYTQLVLAKICLSAVVVAGIALATPFAGWFFAILPHVFKIRWSVAEWEERVGLDLFVVYVGMLAAVAQSRVNVQTGSILRWSMALLGTAVLGGYSYTCKTAIKSTGEHKFWHPYTSFVPILAFIAVRNVSNRARSYYSTSMAALGKCWLETYTLQFHLFLAGDGFGILVLDAVNGGDKTLIHDRWRSLLVILPMFLLVSFAANKAIRSLVNMIVGGPSDVENPIEMGKEDIDLDSMPFLDDEPGVGLFRRPRFTVAKYMKYSPSSRSIIFSPPARFVLALLLMWLLNMLSPVPDTTIPDGYSMSHKGSRMAVPEGYDL